MPNDGNNSTRPAGAVAGDASAEASESGLKRIFLRTEIPKVLDDALEQYSEAVALTKSAAARSILMRVLVKRTMRAPDPLDSGA